VETRNRAGGRAKVGVGAKACIASRPASNSHGRRVLGNGNGQRQGRDIIGDDHRGFFSKKPGHGFTITGFIFRLKAF
jgi:hypothetical protein